MKDNDLADVNRHGEKKVGIIHTSFVSVDAIRGLFGEVLPGVELVNIVDDSMLAEVMKNGGVTPAVVARYCSYVLGLEKLSVDCVLNQCSSVGEVVDIAQQMVRVPIYKIDEPMAEKAVHLGKRITVVATVSSTMGPSVRLVQRTAERLGKAVEVKESLVDGALDILMKEGNREKHNRLVIERIKSEESCTDVFVLAQGSMIVLSPLLQDIGVPVLTSPRLGVERIKRALAG